MENNTKYKYNHFLQKGFVKNFANNDIVKWKRYKTNEGDSFNINETPNAEQPIVHEYFHSLEIETGMNNLEHQGLLVARKIALEANVKEEIKLTRREVVTLKFFSMLSSARTEKIRNDIEELNGDPLFNALMQKDGRSAKEIQEDKIATILKYFNIGSETIDLRIEKDIENIMGFSKIDKTNKTEWEIKQEIMHKMVNEATIESSTLIEIQNALNSHLLIFKFDESNLILQEAMNFTESNLNGGIKYTFMPIAPNVGIMNYFSPPGLNGALGMEQSEFFENDITKPRHSINYIKRNDINKKRNDFIRNGVPRFFPNSQTAKMFFDIKELSKHLHKKDKFTMEILKESKQTSDMCNAMALVHSGNQIIIYQHKKDIADAEYQMEKRKVVRTEEQW